LGAACNTKYRDLKLRFREESWRPDIEEYRLKAEVTGSTVSEILTLINNSRSVVLQDGLEYPIIQIKEMRGVYITDGIPLLQYLRSFKRSIPWCVVNFYYDGKWKDRIKGQHCRKAISKSSHQAVRRILSGRQSNEPSLKAHHITALRRVRRCQGLRRCLKPFRRSSAFLILTPLPLWDNLLRSWCFEVCSHRGMRNDHL
jgi:hypothetical protein